MRYTKLFGKTVREAPKDEVATNAKLLMRAGFIDRLMSGSWTLLPLGWRVVHKIVEIVRQEMDKTGAQEILMPLMHPKNIWNETGRWDSAREVMYQFQDTRGKEFALSFTHEEIVMDLVRKNLKSYQDLPIKIYHFSTKFRNEPRARSGILRGREFLMKDLYSIHTDEKDMNKYYLQVKDAYLKTFKRIGFQDVKFTEAAGGVFTKGITHEFQVLAKGGEDTIYYCDNCNFAQNKEIFKGKVGSPCQSCQKGKMKEGKSIEIGNIFPLGTWYAEKMGVTFMNKKGQKKHPWFASYGIGHSRILGALAEVFNDEKGLIWPETVAPFSCHLLVINPLSKKKLVQPSVVNHADEVYEKLTKAGIEVLYDDREDISAGQKFAGSDLIGIPVRLVVSDKTKNKVEWKKRSEEKTELLTLEELRNKLRK